MTEFKKGKKNKLKIGDTVEITPECVEWFATHLVDNYSQEHNCYYGREILTGFKGIHGWLDAYLSKKIPKGKVIGYGSNSVTQGYSNVYIEVKFKHGKVRGYFDEATNLKKIEKAKKC